MNEGPTNMINDSKINVPAMSLNLDDMTNVLNDLRLNHKEPIKIGLRKQQMKPHND